MAGPTSIDCYTSYAEFSLPSGGTCGAAVVVDDTDRQYALDTAVQDYPLGTTAVLYVDNANDSCNVEGFSGGRALAGVGLAFLCVAVVLSLLYVSRVVTSRRHSTTMTQALSKDPHNELH